jgi:hypothetical protein
MPTPLHCCARPASHAHTHFSFRQRMTRAEPGGMPPQSASRSAAHASARGWLKLMSDMDRVIMRFTRSAQARPRISFLQRRNQ